MINQATKAILLESLKAAERTLEKDLKQDEQSKKVIQYLLDFFKYVGIDTVEKLVLQSRNYIKGQLQIGIDTFVAKVSSAVSSLVNLTFGFLIVSIGLVFGAIALSLYLGVLLESNALGFLVSGVLWIVVMLTTLKILFNKTKLEHFISRKIKMH
ncbi:MAG: hypothetical protein IZT56_13605 [Bacteroidetes bacterium]|nr:hypothetical protein [Bacteroidota bacterium]